MHFRKITDSHTVFLFIRYSNKKKTRGGNVRKRFCWILKLSTLVFLFPRVFLFSDYIFSALFTLFKTRITVFNKRIDAAAVVLEMWVVSGSFRRPDVFPLLCPQVYGLRGNGVGYD